MKPEVAYSYISMVKDWIQLNSFMVESNLVSLVGTELSENNIKEHEVLYSNR